jgi:ubiquinone/menaquinone biosynthesis C-methylase UbiE
MKENMNTKWDYTDLAEAYLKRPDYSDKAIDELLEVSKTSAGDKVCDVGAGVAHLTIKLAERGLNVTSVEPNDAMRERGIKRTDSFSDVVWFEGTGEQTEQPDTAFKLVTFGSSFNVVDRPVALKEVSRISVPHGWFACMWNHRELDDPIQGAIEEVIKSNIKDYAYGSRREDQTSIIQESGLFGSVHKIEDRFYQTQAVTDCVDAWRSHATLQRQAGESFDKIIDQIEQVVTEGDRNEIQVPYTTRIWTAQLQ